MSKHYAGSTHAGDAVLLCDGKIVAEVVPDGDPSTLEAQRLAIGMAAAMTGCAGINPAAVPALVAALRFLVDAAETEPGMSIYRAHIAQARAALALADNS